MDTIVIVSSIKDQASINIAKSILRNYPFKEVPKVIEGNPVYRAEVESREVLLITLNEELIYAQHITDVIPKPEMIIFVSRHSSLSGIPTLSVHVPGNLGSAELGGEPRRVSIAPAFAMKAALKAMNRLVIEENLEYEVSYECTHHGPSLDVPAMFAELGSSPENWRDEQAAMVVAQAVIESILGFNEEKGQPALGIGGPHYNIKFTRKAIEEDIAFGHIIPKYALQWIDADIIRQCVDRTREKVRIAVLDWKGIQGLYKHQIVECLEKIGLSIVKA